MTIRAPKLKSIFTFADRVETAIMNRDFEENPTWAASKHHLMRSKMSLLYFPNETRPRPLCSNFRESPVSSDTTDDHAAVACFFAAVTLASRAASSALARSASQFINAEVSRDEPTAFLHSFS